MATLKAERKIDQPRCWPWQLIRSGTEQLRIAASMQPCDPSAIFGSDVKFLLLGHQQTARTVHIIKIIFLNLACYFQIHSLMLQIVLSIGNAVESRQ